MNVITNHGDDDVERGTARHFLQGLEEVVTANSDRVYGYWYDSDGLETDRYTYDELWREAGVIAHALRTEWKVNRGDHVVLCYNFGLHFFAAFLGCLRAGVVAVLVYPPTPPLTKSLVKMNAVVKDCAAKLILCDSDILFYKRTDSMNLMSRSRHLWPTLDYKNTTLLRLNKNNSKLSWPSFRKASNTDIGLWEEELDNDAVAFLQYTSGSTGEPKGVMITFAALQANVKLILHAFNRVFSENGFIPHEQRSGFSWLPQYHDLGLIFAGIAQFAAGWQMHCMSPITFVKKPTLWMELMAKHRVKWSTGPNFAYKLTARKWQEKRAKLGNNAPRLDLSCIRHLSNVAEPIHLDTKLTFETAFSNCGLQDNWFLAAYGLAENCVGCTWIRDHVQSTTTADRPTQFVAVGTRETFAPGLDIKMVNPDTCVEVPDGTVGELWITGPSVAAGYFGQPEKSEQVFRAKLSSSKSEQGSNNATVATYLRTGDLAFYDETGKIFVCGRIKDLIIVNGSNVYPQDLEQAAQEACSAVRPGCVAAFSSNDVTKDGEVEVVFEIRKGSVDGAEKATEDVYLGILQATGVRPLRVVAIKERTIAKTTSGKIRRRENRRRLHEGELEIVFERGAITGEQMDAAGDQNDNQHLQPLEEGDLESQTLTQQLECNDNQLSMEGEDHDVATAPEIPKLLADRVEEAGNGEAKVREHKTRFQEDVETSDQLESTLNEFFGRSFNWDARWEDLGMSSMSSLELHEAISTEFSRNLHEDVFLRYPTPNDLRRHLHESQEERIPIELPELLEGPSMSWGHMSVVQLLSAVFLLLMFAASAVPSVIMWNHSEGLEPLLIPLVIPAFMASYSCLVLFVKYLLIGRYQAQVIKVPSGQYISWWLVDRAFHYFELFVGWLVLDTPLLRLYYVLLGAKIHPSAQVKAFVREFDLVELHQESILEQNLRCRLFSTRAGENAAKGQFSLRFRPICIEKGAVVRGVLTPGANVGVGALVEKRSVVPEGGQVPMRSKVDGNPSVVVAPATAAQNEKFGLWKCLWLVIELYAHWGFFRGADALLGAILLPTWRYSGLLNFLLILLLVQIISLAASILLKWVLLGKRQAGNADKAFSRPFAAWAADYHFRLSTFLLFSISSNSKVWNVILMLYGMDIDLQSKALVINFPPSQVDLIRVRRSVVSKVAFEVEADGSLLQTVVEDSSIGYNAVVGPGVHIRQAVIPPARYVTSNVTKNEHSQLPARDLVRSLQVDMLYLLLWALLTVSLIPPYELAASVSPGLSLNYYPLLFLAVAVVQLFSSLAILLLVELLTYGLSNKRRTPWFAPMYAVYITANYALQTFSSLPLLWGTCWFNFFWRILGATFRGNGRVLYLGDEFYDAPYLTLRNDTILDGSHISGHYHVYNKLALGPCEATGVINPHSYMASASSAGLAETEESRHFFVRVGASRPFASDSRGSYEGKQQPADGLSMTKFDDHSSTPLPFGQDTTHDDNSSVYSV